eukprot:230743-Pyramimonas_sp.AAC.2
MFNVHTLLISVPHNRIIGMSIPSSLPRSVLSTSILQKMRGDRLMLATNLQQQICSCARNRHTAIQAGVTAATISGPCRQHSYIA